MKLFLKFTAIVEALTGILLVLVPGRVVSVLFGTELTDKTGIILAMLAGVAIFSLSLICWLLAEQDAALAAVQALLVYNVTVTFILLYGKFAFGIQGWVLWLIIIFHGVQSLQSLRFLRKKVYVSDAIK